MVYCFLKAREKIVLDARQANERIAGEFEQSVSAVTQSVAGTVLMLKKSAHELAQIADVAGDEAGDAVGFAETAGRAANTVAAGVCELSVSIGEIAIKVSKQNELTDEANKQTDGGGKSIGSLAKQSRTIGEATRAIVRIAERTDLLSLNAAIEAASSTPSGRGFSVVAQEVKLLAGQAGQAQRRRTA